MSAFRYWVRLIWLLFRWYLVSLLPPVRRWLYPLSRWRCGRRGHVWQDRDHGGPPWWRLCEKCGYWERDPGWTLIMAEAWLAELASERVQWQ